MMSIKHVTSAGRLLCACALLAWAAAASAGEGLYASHGMAQASPSQVYLRYLDVVAEMDSLEDLLPFSPIAQARNRETLEAMPPEQRKKALRFMRGMSLTDAEVLSEQVDGDTATLEVRGQSVGLLSGESEVQWGTISLVRKAGEWKVDNSALRDKPQP